MSGGRFCAAWLPAWPTYAKMTGLPLPDNGHTQQRMPCTIHGGARDSLCVNVLTGAWHCKACDARGGDVLAHYRAVHGASFAEAAKALGAWTDESGRQSLPTMLPAQTPAELPEASSDANDWKRTRAAEIWASSQQIKRDSIAARYLADSRHCVLPPPDSDLRWLPDLRLFGFDGPALVGRMSAAEDHREMRGLHLTWMRNHGDRWVRVERRYLGPKRGCVVRLWDDEFATSGLALSEGVETALSLASAYRPAWACMDAGNLAAFPVLRGIECLVIGADHDDAGLAAAATCAARWRAAGADVMVIAPAAQGADLNDLAQEDQHEHA